MLPLHSIALLSKSEVVFMSFILFLIITIMVSATINVALLTIIYIQYVITYCLSSFSSAVEVIIYNFWSLITIDTNINQVNKIITYFYYNVILFGKYYK